VTVAQTRIRGTDPSEYCAKCFKDTPKAHFIDGVQVYLCGGCGYDLRTWTNFLRANSVGIRRIIILPVDESDQGLGEEGKEGVKGEGNPPANATGRGEVKE